MDPNTQRSPKRASAGPYKLRKRIKTIQYADNSPRRGPKKKLAPGGRQQKQQRIWEHQETCQLLAHFQWSFSNGVDFLSVAFPKFQNTAQPTFTDDQAEKQLKHLSTRHGQMEGDNDYENLLEFGLELLNLPEETSRDVDQFFNRIPDINAGRSEVGGALAKWCTKRLLVSFMVSPEKLKAILPDEEKDQSVGQADEDSSAEPTQPTEVQPPSHRSSRLSSADQNADSPSPKRAETTVEQRSADYPSPDGREIWEIETLLLASEIEKERIKRELDAVVKYKPDARVQHILEQKLDYTVRRVYSSRFFNVEIPGMNGEKISRLYMMLFRNIQNACFDVCRNHPEAPEEQTMHSDLAESWALMAFGQGLKDCIPRLKDSRNFKAELLLGLLASAVIEMVFEPAFPAFIHPPNPIAEAYRQIIMDVAGVNELHRADCIVLPQVTDNSRAEIIQRKVKELERILYKHLDSFWAFPDNDNDNLEEVLRKKINFGSFLAPALELKLDLITTATRLKFFYYESDEPFDEEYMERCPFSDRERNTIKGCLFPLLLWPRAREETATSSEYVLEHNTKYSMYFTRLTEGSHRDLEVVTKAIVLT
ncbi:hypothetical protein NW761_010628 [Fusarium oxysporum]|nr:hypothetical protein NW758_008084 [Fusarium oxysporum]WKT50288.1 hypothetical protein QSH57_015236 [Fusarium oxysporum f. sp. vasinfectum]KAJ4053032.1 hypothetical protein NW753_007208 [Fusarium oxysporum]KAJ4054178.1 hypothetical protein NW763_007730 [Fusarium oxysporum]KAJ4081041.1 hypothetical protein NW761_010628 [Fusarium oxysporum]